MKAPDRIFFTEDFVCGIDCNKPVPGKKNVEYVRKDTLLEWAKMKKDHIKIVDWDKDYFSGLDFMLDQLIDKLNSL